MVNNSVLELKKILNGMENDLGLSKLSEVERNVLYAVKDLEKEQLKESQEGVVLERI